MADIGDIVLIHFEDKPLTFARIETIEPDVKKDWYHVTFLVLQVPVNLMTWLIRDVYINGEEFFMGGKRMRIDKVVPPEAGPPGAADDDDGEKPDGSGETDGRPAEPGRVIRFPGLKTE